MRNYLFTISEEERNNILDKHKTLYDGYAVKQNTPNEQPLYVQDFANDKEGITINSRGEISTYNNKIYMKESKNVCSECGLYEEVCECGKGGMYEDMEEGIYDVEDLGSSKFDYVEEKEQSTSSFTPPKITATEDSDTDIALAMQTDEEECNECGGGMYERDIDEIMDEIADEIEYDDETEDIKESINESIKWFKRFKNYN